MSAVEAMKVPRQAAGHLCHVFENPDKFKDDLDRMPHSLALLIVAENSKKPNLDVDFLANREQLISDVKCLAKGRGKYGLQFVDYQDNMGRVDVDFLEEALQLIVCRGLASRLPYYVQYVILVKNGKTPSPLDRLRELQHPQQGLPVWDWDKKNQEIERRLQDLGVASMEVLTERQNLKRARDELDASKQAFEEEKSRHYFELGAKRHKLEAKEAQVRDDERRLKQLVPKFISKLIWPAQTEICEQEEQ